VVVSFCLGWGRVVLWDGLVLVWLGRGCVAVCVLVPSRPPFKVAGWSNMHICVMTYLRHTHK